MADNNKNISYDMEYDKTNYKFINKYKLNQEKLSPEEFKELIETKLISEKNITQEMAKQEASAIILGKRLVENGDYAILIITNSTTDKNSAEYFIRKDNIWIQDKEISDNVIIKDNKLFCNLQENCISENDKCNDFATTEAKINDDTLKQIYEEFDQTYGEKEDNLRDRIDALLAINIIRIRYLKRLEQSNFLKYNKQKVLLGETIIDDIETTDFIVSPYDKLRNIILGQTDFVKKQNDIQKFVLLFTREPFLSDDQYWLYCVKTNIKLLPIFISNLANAFISGKDYLLELDNIATKQGTISDDGDAYVDKYSGYFIKKIAFDTEEGFTEEGFKLKTREKLEADLGDAVLDQINNPKIKGTIENQETIKITNIINAISGPSGMNIDLTNEKDFIIRNVLLIYNKTTITKKQYDLLIQKQQKKAKKYYHIKKQLTHL